MKTRKTVTAKPNTDQPIPYVVTDMPVPYRVRVDTPSPDLRAFVVPKLSIQPFIPGERESGMRLKVA